MVLVPIFQGSWRLQAVVCVCVFHGTYPQTAAITGRGCFSFERGPFKRWAFFEGFSKLLSGPSGESMFEDVTLVEPVQLSQTASLPVVGSDGWFGFGFGAVVLVMGQTIKKTKQNKQTPKNPTTDSAPNHRCAQGKLKRCSPIDERIEFE